MLCQVRSYVLYLRFLCLIVVAMEPVVCTIVPWQVFRVHDGFMCGPAGLSSVLGEPLSDKGSLCFVRGDDRLIGGAIVLSTAQAYVCFQPCVQWTCQGLCKDLRFYGVYPEEQAERLCGSRTKTMEITRGLYWADFRLYEAGMAASGAVEGTFYGLQPGVEWWKFRAYDVRGLFTAGRPTAAITAGGEERGSDASRDVGSLSETAAAASTSCNRAKQSGCRATPYGVK